MSLRTDRDDTRTQQEAVERARTALQEALTDAARELELVARALRNRRLTPDDVTRLVGGAKAEWLAVERAEETLLIAMHDLAGARGEDL